MLAWLCRILPFGLLAATPPTVAATPNEPCPVIAKWARLLDPGPQRIGMVETFIVHDQDVRAYRLAPPTGPFRKYYVFMIGPAGWHGCPERIALVGSYDITNADNGPQDKRVYHFDLYVGDRHQTLWLRHELPSYEQARQELRAYLTAH